MTDVPFTIVDVFAEQRFAGNQLMVCRPQAELSSDVMLAIAKEIHFSETTFLVSEKQSDGGYPVRIFTPRAEIPFAGHPTLGTAAVIQQECENTFQPTIRLNLAVGQIPVTFGENEDGLLWMQQNPPVFGAILPPSDLTAVTNLSIDQIDLRYPIQEVSTGLPTLILPLKTRTALQAMRVGPDLFLAWVEGRQAKTLFAFCPMESGQGFYARFFAHYYDIPEDPATGSANGSFAGYLVQHQVMGTEPIDTTVEQGQEIGRPSKLYLRAAASPNGVSTQVGGKVQPIAKGTISV